MTSNAYRLPTCVVPRHYDLLWRVDLAAGTFSGEVSIDVELRAPTDTVELHCGRELRVDSLVVLCDDADVPVESLETPAAGVHVKENVIRARLAEPLDTGCSDVSLCIHFHGALRDDAQGMYASMYRDDGGADVRTVSTQFEATAARLAFPCFDEPAAKATFAVSVAPVYDPSHSALPWRVLSNMPVVDDADDDDDGTGVVRFQTTPVMSTYLLAVNIAPLVSPTVHVTVSGTEVRVWAYPGQERLTGLPQAFAAEVLDEFGEMFGIPYPLPKCDLIPVKDFQSGAMENWGLITFREQYLLADRHTAPLALHGVLSTVAHELAHQWFGNLVTMRWWDELWLNEGFATFGAMWVTRRVLATAAGRARFGFSPSSVELMFLNDEALTAMESDALPTARAVIPDPSMVNTAEDIDQLFDSQAYAKSAMLLYMLFARVGERDFTRGLHAYLSAHAYGNATSADLWAALSSDAFDAAAFMTPWLTQPGVPCVRLHGDWTVSQQRFYAAGEDVEDPDRVTTFPIPAPNGKVLKAHAPEPYTDSPPAYPNPGFAAYALVVSDDVDIVTDAPAPAPGLGSCSTSSEVLHGATVLNKLVSIKLGVESGAMRLRPSFLEFILASLTSDKAAIVHCASSIVEAWARLCPKARDGVMHRACDILGPTRDRMRRVFQFVMKTDDHEDDDDDDDDHVTPDSVTPEDVSAEFERLRLLDGAGDSHAGVLLDEHGNALLSHASALPDSVVDLLVRRVVSSLSPGDTGVLDKLFTLYASDTSSSTRRKPRLLAAMGAVRDPDVMPEVLHRAFRVVRPTEFPYLLVRDAGEAANAARGAWVRDNWAALGERAGRRGYGMLIQWLLQHECSEKAIETWSAFFSGKATSGYANSVTEALQGIRSRVRAARSLAPLCACVAAPSGRGK